MVFFKSFVRKLGVYCIIGFVIGILFAFIMPPIIIAIVEGILLVLLCVCFFCT